MVGPLARVNLNFGQMAPQAQRAALRLNLNFPDYNPYHSILARLLEIIHAIEASLEYLKEAPEEEEMKSRISGNSYQALPGNRTKKSHVPAPWRSGTMIRASPVPPTAFQKSFIPFFLDLVKETSPFFAKSRHIFLNLPAGFYEIK